jgi:hypothetical protein
VFHGREELLSYMRTKYRSAGIMYPYIFMYSKLDGYITDILFR